MLVSDDQIGARAATVNAKTRKGRAQHGPTRATARSRYRQTLENLAIVFFLSLYFSQDVIKSQRSRVSNALILAAPRTISK